jgi:hypothetical protein
MDKVIKTFKGDQVETQRLVITEEQWSEQCGNFVTVKHTGGDNSVTTEYFTYEEGRFLLDALKQIYQAP